MFFLPSPLESPGYAVGLGGVGNRTRMILNRVYIPPRSAIVSPFAFSEHAYITLRSILVGRDSPRVHNHNVVVAPHATYVKCITQNERVSVVEHVMRDQWRRG